MNPNENEEYDSVDFSNNSSSCSSSSAVDISAHTGRDSATSASNEFVKDESHAVNRSKMLVYAALLLAAAIVGSIAYVVLREKDEETMKSEVRFRAAEKTI